MTRLLVFCIAAQQLTGVQSYQMMPQRAAIDPLIYRARAHSLFSNSGRDEESSEPIFVDSAGKEFSQEQLDEIEEAQPSELSIMKDLLGINIFTYILACLIVIFAGLNLTLGPGWLGGTLGIQGTGSIEEVSPSLPNTVDLNKDEYLL